MVVVAFASRGRGWRVIYYSLSRHVSKYFSRIFVSKVSGVQD